VNVGPNGATKNADRLLTIFIIVLVINPKFVSVTITRGYPLFDGDEQMLLKKAEYTRERARYGA
jgi:hypothetical protein